MPILRAALILGLLSAVGPFAVDTYLPAKPAMAAGLASSLGGTLRVVSGAAVVVLTRLLFDGTALPMIAAIALCAARALAISLVTLRTMDRVALARSDLAGSSQTP